MILNFSFKSPSVYVLLATTINCYSFAQVGINTSNPQSTLDINAGNTSLVQGLLLPRLTSNEIRTMSQNLLSSSHNSLIVFALNATTTGDFVTSKITEPGFYRYVYNGSGGTQKYWKKIEPTAFERIVQDGKSGIRIIDADIQKYGLIGENAVDVSYSDENYVWLSTANGARGDNSFAAGLNTISRGNASTAVGNKTEAGGNGSFSGGQNTRSVGANSFAYGEGSSANNANSVVFGKTNVNSGSNSSIIAGRDNTITNAMNSAILSGHNNSIVFNNTAIDNYPYNSIGVANNIVSGNSNSIIGSSASTKNVIVGGTNNVLSEGIYSIIGGGAGNKIRPSAAPYDYVWYASNTISGGEGNEINADRSVIGGGDRNLIRLEGSGTYPQGAGMGVISGGQFNKILYKGHFGSIMGGRGNNARGSYSFVTGASNVAQSVGEFAIGFFGTLYNPQYPNAYTHDGTWIVNLATTKDRLFNVGNGAAPSEFDFSTDISSAYASRSDAFTILKNGQVGIDIDNFETNTTTAKLQVNGGIKISSPSNTLAGSACDNNNRGQIIFVEDNFYGCKSTGWVILNN
ncbi:hypothetical protein [Chryseobacterium oryzae]|uniref:Hep_Hag n=1 Tax=Chryseobacterium oryzae TaxID=2929799 RepID=A0ABY4BEC6_9FLAO|nr:hypothetical protein [Chryseobacterium oryzae]UOE37467.1 hypothetical protein MTP08_10355 [Chryseobacterium oryzae]